MYLQLTAPPAAAAPRLPPFPSILGMDVTIKHAMVNSLIVVDDFVSILFTVPVVGKLLYLIHLILSLDRRTKEWCTKMEKKEHKSW